jgi:hypothetical protein
MALKEHMRNHWLAIVTGAAILTGCGGGGPSSGNESAQLPSGPKIFTAASATVGDYFTWEHVTREQGSSADSYNYDTSYVRSVGVDGAVGIKYFADYANGTDTLVFSSNTASIELDKLGRWLGSSNESCKQVSNPPFHLVALNSLATGMSWQHSSVVQATCSSGSAPQVAIEFKDDVGAIEQVTVPAGTFTTFKISRHETADDGNFRTVFDRTCWWEPDLGVDVKCVTNATVTDKASDKKRVVVQTEALLGYSKQKLGRKSDTVMRFSGNWKGRLEGTALGQNVAGTCTLAIDWSGNIGGACFGSGVAFNVGGKVSADGSLFLMANNGNGNQFFTGNFDSLQQMSGVWSVPTHGSGTWVITQD